MEHKIIRPGIDPLTPKNKELSERDINKYLNKFKIPLYKPLLTQISRFDKWKDPVGVIEVFKQVKKEVDCRLVLCGSMAADDPEGIQIYEKVKQRANNLLAIGDVILITSENNIIVNALQRSSAVIIQKSLQEGFGLTVTEALWKETPVVASNVGGIPLQITEAENGSLIEPNDNNGFAQKIVELIRKSELVKKIGKNGRETVRQNFLVTRILHDYLALFNEILN